MASDWGFDLYKALQDSHPDRLSTVCTACSRFEQNSKRIDPFCFESIPFRLESESHKSSQHWLTTWLTGQVQVLSQPFHLKPSSTPHAVQAFARIKTAPMLTPRTSFEQPDARHRVVRPESQNARNWMIGMDVWLVGNHNETDVTAKRALSANVSPRALSSTAAPLHTLWSQNERPFAS